MYFFSAQGRIAGRVNDVQIPHDVAPAVAGAVYGHLREVDVLVAVAAAAILLQEQIQALRWRDVRAEPLGGVAATVIRDLAHQSRGLDDLLAPLFARGVEVAANARHTAAMVPRLDRRRCGARMDHHG